MQSIEQLTTEILSLPSLSRALLAAKLVESLEFDTDSTLQATSVNDKGAPIPREEAFHLEQLKLELNCRLEEYRSLRSEMVSTLTAAYQTTNLTLIAIGASVSGSKLIAETPLLLVVATLVFYSFLWAQLRYVVSVLKTSNYIVKTIAPAIQKLLVDIAPRDNLNSILGWEVSGREEIHSKDKLFYPIEGARYGLPLLSAIFTFVVYLDISYDNNQLHFIRDSVLCVLNLALIIYSVFMILKIRQMLRR